MVPATEPTPALSPTPTVEPTPTPAPNIDTSSAPDTIDELRSANDAAVDELAKLQTFDSRKYDIVTPVRNQGGKNICWAYAVAGAAETSVLREGIDPKASAESLHFNEQHLANACLNLALDPLGNNLPDYNDFFSGWYSGGETHEAVYAMLRWNAPAQFAADNTRITKPDYLVENAIRLPSSDSEDNINALKRAIIKYGCVAVSWDCGNGGTRYYYNNKGYAGNGHASVIVGWDDNVNKDRFYFDDIYNPAARNGAWILKNSWGKSAGAQGYYYVSYDVLLSKCYALDMCSSDTYDNNYYYDSSVMTSSSSSLNCERAAAMFEARTAFADREEFITGVNVAVNEGSNYKIKVEIYKDPAADFIDIYSPKNDPSSGTLVAAAESDTLVYPGAYTVKLKKPVKLEQNQTFSAVVELTNGAKVRFVSDYEKTDAVYPANDMTFRCSDGEWKNVSYGVNSNQKPVAQIKVFTKNEILPEDQHKGSALQYADIRFDRRSVPYNKEAQHPDLTVYFDGEPLVEGQDYTVDYPDSVRIGRYRATITGIGGYSGSRNIDYSVKQAQAPLNKPPRTMEVAGDYKTYAEVPLPEGWVWGDPNMLVASG